MEGPVCFYKRDLPFALHLRLYGSYGCFNPFRDGEKALFAAGGSDELKAEGHAGRVPEAGDGDDREA